MKGKTVKGKHKKHEDVRGRSFDLHCRPVSG